MIQSEDLNFLFPRVKYLAERLLNECKEQGINIKITQTYRDKEYQDYLYAQGRTRSGNIITNARGGYSFHNFNPSFAFDVCINSKSDAYNIELLNKVGQIGKSIGLEWGGDFKSIVDRPHFQYTEGLTLSQIRAGKLPKKINYVPVDIKKDVKEVIEMAKSWMQENGEKAIESLAEKKLLDKESWKNKDLEKENVPLWLFFVLMDRISK